ncbi:MAG TPA: proline dehydrogenase family protein [Thermoanaerobaculia bacterium]|nr:proline dehydrogenase family protein [Thermoanaerobaculia bacterium]
MLRRLLGVALPLIPKPIVRRVANRYVAGETLDAAIAKVEELNRRGLEVTLALLGEEVTERPTAEAAVEEYLQVLERLEPAGLRSGISIKLTLLGLEIEEAYCRSNLIRVLDAAAAHDTFVRIDMEDHTCTDATLRLYREMRDRYGNVGTVLQAYLRRTPRDIETLPEGASIRLCKGIYIEPEEVAYHGYEEVRREFVRDLGLLFDRGARVAVATHDRYLVDAARKEIRRRGLAGSYEFQTLLGVTEGLRDELHSEGHRVRVYVPYGRDWYAYSVRRLRENPQIAVYVLKAMFGRA